MGVVGQPVLGLAEEWGGRKRTTQGTGGQSTRWAVCTMTSAAGL